MFWRLLRYEVQKMLFRPRILFVLLALAGFDIWSIMTVASSNVWMLFTNGTSATFILPLLIFFIAGDSLVVERHNSYSWLVLTRGLTKFRYLAIKMLGSAIVCLSLVLALTLTFFLTYAVHGGVRPEVERPLGRGFHPELLLHNPLLHTATIVVLAVFACIAVLGLMFLISTYTANPYMAMSLPLLLILVPTFFIPASLLWLAPYERIVFLITTAPWVNMLNMTVYWLLFGGVLYIWAYLKYLYTEGI